MQLTAVDRAIAAISPAWAAKRAYFRAVLSAAQREGLAYDAGKTGRRADGWITSASGPIAEIASAAPIIRARARDFVRNNPVASSIVRKLSAKTVGAGIVPRLKRAPGAAIGDPRRKVAREIWEAFADNSDPEGQLDIHGQMNLLARTVFESGEALIVFKPRASSSRMRIPLQIQVLEPDWIDSSRNMLMPDGSIILQGVQFNPDGSRAGYWLFKQHPGDMLMNYKGGLLSEFTPASQVRHVFEPLRPGQARGITIFAPVALKLRDIDDYDDAELMRRKIASVFVAFVEKPGGAAASPLASVTATDSDNKRIETMRPGLIQYLNLGEKVTTSAPPSGGDSIDYLRSQFHLVAAGCGVSYSMATGDLSQSNFTQHRAGMIDFWDQLDQWQWLMFIRQAYAPVWDMVGRYAAASGLRSPLDPWLAAWHPPARRMTSPKEESDSIRELARTGVRPLVSAMSDQGEDPEELMEDIDYGNKLMDHYGIVLDSDPRKVGRVSAGAAPSPGGNPEAPAPV